MAGDAGTFQHACERGGGRLVADLLKRAGDGAEVGILALLRELVRLLDERGHGRAHLRVAERDRVAVHPAHAAVELSHAAVVPAEVPVHRLELRQDERRAVVASEHREQVGVVELRLPFRRRVGAGEERTRPVGVGHQHAESLVAICEVAHGLGERFVGERERVGLLRHVRVDHLLLHEMRLERLHVHVAHGDALLRGVRRGPARRVPLVLHVGLHAQDRHRVAVRADAKTRHEHAVERLREQAAVGQVHVHRLVAGILDEERVVRGLPVRVEVRVGAHDRVGIGALVHHVGRRHVERAHHAAALAAVDHLRLVPRVGRQARARAEREVEEVGGVRVVHEAEVGVGVARAERVARDARALHGEFGVGDELGVGAGERGNLRVARGVHHVRAAHRAARAVRHHHHHASHARAVHDHALDHRAEPDLRARAPLLAAVPLALALREHRPHGLHALVDLVREAHPVAEVVEADEAVRGDAPHHVEVVAHDRLRARARRRDAGRTAARARARHERVARRENRHGRVVRDGARRLHEVRRQRL